MSNRYTQLTEAERYHIYTMKKQGYSNTAIGQGMGRSRTTVWRELQRNTGQCGYRHQQAQRLAVARHQAQPKRVKLTPEVQGNTVNLVKASEPQYALATTPTIRLSRPVVFRKTGEVLIRDEQEGLAQTSTNETVEAPTESSDMSNRRGKAINAAMQLCEEIEMSVYVKGKTNFTSFLIWWLCLVR